MTVSKTEHDKLKNVFSDELDKKYESIVAERSSQYLQGLLLGFLISAAVLYYAQQRIHNPFSRVMTFVAISLFTAMLYYMLMPKSDYMLNHLKTPEENKAWVEMYKTMQSRYRIGMILGALASIPIANAYCGN
jgi:ABC-type phosphate/phosphonate transport system permease subunit